MTNTAIYQDIARRTGGDIYIGVVGPVRTGKSTFIKRFMETLVLPGIDDVYRRERARDELPQSGSGRTIMTAEPKFVPEEAAQVTLEGGAVCAVRLIDSVGYLVEGAIGSEEDGAERMVTTPWFDTEIPMRQAAEVGTRKVIEEHSTIGIVVTTDGTVTEIPREAYVEAEQRVVRELQEIGKPFVILLNSAAPQSPQAVELRERLSAEYGVECILADCLTLDEEGITGILRGALLEFPISRFGVFLPPWIDALPASHPRKRELYGAILASAEEASVIRDVARCAASMTQCESVETVSIREIDLGTGAALLDLQVPRCAFFETLSQESGFPIRDDGDLMTLLAGLSDAKGEYERVAAALEEVRATGYGVVLPTMEELSLEEPEIVRQGGRYGVRLKASAPSIHMIAVDVETEVSPGLAGERSSEDVVSFLLQEFEGDVTKIWDSNIFGKSLNEIAGESLHTKIRKMPADARQKLRDTLGRVVNEGGSGLICILV